jgi:hypothetical protein
MQIRNNYTKEVYNGDIGVVRAVDQEEGQVAVAYPGEMGPKVVVYEREELDELVLAYATTVHKSQGSEYPVVVMPVSTQHYMMLQRHLLYTAVTRARKLVILVGTKKALAIAVRNNRLEDRFSRLADRRRGRGARRVCGPPGRAWAGPSSISSSPKGAAPFAADLFRPARVGSPRPVPGASRASSPGPTRSPLARPPGWGPAPPR